MQRQRNRGRILRLETVVRIPWPSHLHAQHVHICEQYAQHTRHMTVRQSTACSSMAVTQPDARTRWHTQTKRKQTACNERRATSGVQREAAISSRLVS